MFMVLMGTVIIAGIVGYVCERTGFTNNGILQSIIICGAARFWRISCGLCSASASVHPASTPLRRRLGR